MKRVVLLTAFAGCVVAGCTDISDALNIDAFVPDQWQQAAPSDAQPTKLDSTWWQSAKDSDLDALIANVEKQNLSLEQARYRLIAARAGTGGREYLPALNANASGQFNRTLNDQGSTQLPGNIPGGGISSGNKLTGYYQAGFDASWEIPLFGQYAAARDITQAQKDFATADIQAIHASVVSEAVSNYIQLRNAQNVMTSLEAIRDAQKKIVDLYAIKAKAGLGPRTDEFREMQSLQSTTSEIESMRNTILEKQYKLAQLVGKPVLDPAWQKTKPIPVFAEISVADTPLDVVRNRPDIRKAEQSVIVEANNLDIAKSDMWPKLTLTGNLTQLGNITGNPFPGNIVQASGSPAISLPLFDWGIRRAKADSQEAKLGETASQYREAVVIAMTEVEQALGNYSNARAQTGHTTKALDNATTVAKHAEILRKEGLSDTIDPLNAEVTRQRAKIELLNAQSAEGTYLTSLTKALGGGVETKGHTHE